MSENSRRIESLQTDSSQRIEAVDACTVRASVPEVIRFGAWVMEYREFALVRVRTSDGLCGYAFTLSRDGPIAEMISSYIGPRYLGRDPAAPKSVFADVQRSNMSCLAAGVGLRALSLVDLATWDIAAKLAGRPMAEFLGGDPARMPVTAIVGYPPTLSPQEVFEQVSGLYEGGWRLFKLPMAAKLDVAKARLEAAASVSGDIEVSCDGAWMFDSADDAAAFLQSLDCELGWFEDPFPPGNARIIAALRERSPFPIAFGDEQGGAHYPESLLAHNAVDIVRVDATCMGGLSSLAEILEQVAAAGVRFEPHMNAHVHSQIFAGLGYPEARLEWGVPGTGVDQFADSLVRPAVSDGLMAPLEVEAGFGTLVNPDWVRAQPHDDPAGILDEAAAQGAG